MKFLISPAKSMKKVKDFYVSGTEPIFMNRAISINNDLKSLELSKLKQMFKTSDKLTKQIRNDIIEFNRLNYPTIYLFNGLQYKYLNYESLDKSSKSYLDNNLFILSGLYGVLKPTDMISPYRLDFKDNVNSYKTFDLYQQDLVDFFDTKEIYINLMSKEYSNIIDVKIPMIDIVFAELINDKIVVKSTVAKMARGSFLKYMSEIKADTIDDIKKFDEGFLYNENYSTTNKLIFFKQS